MLGNVADVARRPSFCHGVFTQPRPRTDRLRALMLEAAFPLILRGIYTSYLSRALKFLLWRDDELSARRGRKTMSFSKSIKRFPFALKISMKARMTGAILGVTLLGGLAGEAQALNFNFTITNDPLWGNVSGDVTGEIFGLVDNATSSATSVQIFTWPAGLIPSASQSYYTAPIDATTWSSQIENSFTVVAGVVTGGGFHADNSTAVSYLDRLYVNGDGPCQSGPTCSFLSLGSNDLQYVWAESNAFTLFTSAAPGDTPLPAALPLLASGLGGLGLIQWRRKRKAAALAA